jgi:hypothetical protein
MQAKVLLIGHDDWLLHPRGLLMRHENFRVYAAFDVGSLTSDACMDVAVATLCHSLSLDEKRSAINIVRCSSPQASAV